MPLYCRAEDKWSWENEYMEWKRDWEDGRRGAVQGVYQVTRHQKRPQCEDPRYTLSIRARARTKTI